MKTLITTLAITMFSTVALAASHAAFKAVDADSDGKVTMEELKTTMPDAGDDKFKAADADGDGALSEAEYEAMMAG